MTAPGDLNSKKCEAWECAYHACMSNDCMKEEVLKNGGDFGMSKCEVIEMKKNVPEVERLSELQSQQIALLGYIQQEDLKWYVYEKSDRLGALPSSPPPAQMSIKLKIVSNYKQTQFYMLTTDHRYAMRLPKP